MNKIEFKTLEIGDSVYYIKLHIIIASDRTVKCSYLDCRNNWKTTPPRDVYYRCRDFNCQKGKTFRYKKDYKVIEKKVLDLKASGSVQTDYDPGFDGGPWGDYHEASETWMHHTELYLTRQEATAAAKIKSKELKGKG